MSVLFDVLLLLGNGVAWTLVYRLATHPARSAHDSTDVQAPLVLRGQSGPDGPTAARGG